MRRLEARLSAGEELLSAEYYIYVLRNIYKYICETHSKPRDLYFTKRYAMKDRGMQGEVQIVRNFLPSPSPQSLQFTETRRYLCADCARSPRARMKIPADCNQASLPTSVLDTESTRRSKGFARLFRFKEALRFHFEKSLARFAMRSPSLDLTTSN